MHALFVDYLDRLEANIREMQKQLDGLSVEAVDWRPGPDMNSLAVITAHTAGSTRFWLDDMITGNDSGRDRDSEFAIKGVDAEALKARLDDSLNHARRVVESLSVDDLESGRMSARHGKEYRVAWSMMHALDHIGEHVGHMQMTRQMWDQQQG